MSDLSVVIEKLKAVLASENILEDQPMGPYCSFRCGGRAALLLCPEDEAQLSSCLQALAQEGADFMFLGNGSNVLFKDSGYAGAVIKPGKGFETIRTEGSILTAGAAVPLSLLSRTAAAQGLSGLEFACGIPGSVGGAVFMNAGAYGGEMKAVLTSVRSMDRQGRIVTRTADQLDMGYRHSVFMENGEFILEASVQLQPADPQGIRDVMADLMQQRNAKQPVNYPSAGSFFKRPEGYFAGKLIQDASLKGASVGGAQVSELHAGFIINKDGATASDVLALMELVQTAVRQQFGVELEPEVRIIG